MPLAGPITRPPGVAELAYEAIRDMLTEGVFEEDERLVEATLSVGLGTSRTPVREALARLASEGFLIAVANGYRAPRISAQDIINMSQLRALLEPEAARQAALNPGTVGLAEMREAVAAAVRAHEIGDSSRVLETNRAYRRGWQKRISNPMLLDALTRVMGTLQLIRRRTVGDATLRAYILDMQEGLLDRIERGDGEGAAAWQLEKIQGLHQLILTKLFAQAVPS